MTKTYSYILLFIVITNYLRPILPYIDYQINKKYIAEKLCENRDKPKCCCQGKCYLNKQLAKQTDNNDTPKRNDNRKTQNNEVKEYLNALVKVPEPGYCNFTVSFSFQIFYTFSPVTEVFSPPWQRV